MARRAGGAPAGRLSPAVLVLMLLAACAGPASPPDGRVVAFDDAGLRITLPDGWEALRSADVGTPRGSSLFFVSNQALGPECAEARARCVLPVAELRDGGVLIWWSTVACAGVDCELPDGERRLISGREAAFAPDTGTCLLVNGTAEDVYAVMVTPQRVDWIVVCARRPGAGERAAVASILDGADWRTP
jgi:hypothetical protein